MERNGKRNLRASVIATAVAGLFSVGMNGAYGAGFALIEHSASGMGNAYAGAAAVAEDASTVFFNPAGMSFLEGNQFVAAGHAIILSAEFSGTGSNPLLLGGGTASGGNGGDFGGTGFVPNLYLTWGVGERWDLGLGINAPFGLVTEYDSDWVGRFQGIKSEITSLNINPAVSYEISDTISIGVGLNYQQLDAELTNAVALPPPFGPAEGRTKLVADDDGWGWNIGAMFQLSPATRLGVAYRSEIDYELKGDVTTTDLGGTVLAPFSGPSQTDATMPDMFSLSIAYDASDRFELLADITRTGWSSLSQLLVRSTTDGTLFTVLDIDFDDAFRYSVGGNFKLNEKWTLKAGLAFDETPVKNAQTRTVRIPDNDRTWISIGGQLKVGRSSRWDFGYSHIFIKDAPIDSTRSQQAPGFTEPTPVTPLTDTTVTGNYTGDVDIFSVQYTLVF